MELSAERTVSIWLSVMTDDDRLETVAFMRKAMAPQLLHSVVSDSFFTSFSLGRVTM